MSSDKDFSFFNLFVNAGAIIGAVLGAALCVAFWYWLEWDLNRSETKLGVLLVCMGFFGGSYLWAWAFEKKPE